MTRPAILTQALYAGAAALALEYVHVAGPHARIGNGPAVAAGLGVALLLYAGLAHGVARPPLGLLLPAAAGAVSEEIVWRWAVLAGAAPAIGWGGALALSSAGFAGVHTRSATIVYLLIGGAFGGVFLATGRLAAAVAAHGGYNLLVLLWRRP